MLIGAMLSPAAACGQAQTDASGAPPRAPPKPLDAAALAPAIVQAAALPQLRSMIVAQNGGVLVEPGDVAALAEALHRALRLDRATVRRRAETSCSAEEMIDAYERLYVDTVRGDRAA